MVRQPEHDKDAKKAAAAAAKEEDPRKQIDAYYQVIRNPDLKLCIASLEGDANFALAAIADGADVNALDKETGMRPIHLAASGGFTSIVDALLESGACDLTLRDHRGRLASDCAAYAAKDYVLADRLAEKEAQQFKAAGKDPRRRAVAENEAAP